MKDYCALECDLLAQTMEKLRGYCDGAGIRPSSWNGAGKLLVLSIVSMIPLRLSLYVIGVAFLNGCSGLC